MSLPYLLVVLCVLFNQTLGRALDSAREDDSGARSFSTIDNGTTILLPAVHWTHPSDDIRNLEPSENANLYYCTDGVADPSVQHQFAHLTTNLTHLSVVLAHSSYIKDISCSDGGIIVTFTTKEAFDYASTKWSAVAQQLALITHDDGCHGDTADQRTVWKVDALEFTEKTLSVSARVERELDFAQFLSHVTMVWGTYVPGDAPDDTSTSGGDDDTHNSSASQLSSGSAPYTRLRARQSSSTVNSTTNGSPCGDAPSSILDDLPTANCGDPNFDQNIDNALGYLNWSTTTYGSSMTAFIPGVNLTTYDLTGNGTNFVGSSASIRKRFSFSSIVDSAKNFATSVVSNVSDVVSNTASAVVSGAQAVASTALNVVSTVTTYVDTATEFTPSISVPGTFTVAPANNSQSPWGPAALIYNGSTANSAQTANADIALYCVNCGVRATVILGGSASFSASGLHDLQASVGLNFYAGLSIGVDANAVYSDTKKKELVNRALPALGFSVAKVLSGGVFVEVDAVAQIDVNAAGQAIAGISISIPDFQATLDLVDESKSGVTGSAPKFTEYLKYKGQVDAQVTLSLPISLNVGFKIIPLGLNRDMALIETPSVYGQVVVDASNFDDGSTCPNGVQYLVNVQNEVEFDLDGEQTFELSSYSSPALLSGCKSFSKRSENDLVQREEYLRILKARQANATVLSNGTSANLSPNSSDMVIISPDTQPGLGGNVLVSPPLSDVVTNLTTDPNSAQFQHAGAQALAMAAMASNPNNLSYTTVVDLHQQFVLSPSTDGNLNVIPWTLNINNGSALFAEFNGVIVGDANDRYLHYYPDEMSAYNVSRIRLSDQIGIPNTAAIISLTWLDWQPADPSIPNLYLAVDSLLNLFNPVLCNFANGAPSKVFVVNGPTGLQTLQSNNDLKFTVTGAPITNCYPLALVPGIAIAA